MNRKVAMRSLRTNHPVLNAANLIEEDSNNKMQESSNSSSLNIELKALPQKTKKRIRKILVMLRRRSSLRSKDNKDSNSQR